MVGWLLLSMWAPRAEAGPTLAHQGRLLDGLGAPIAGGHTLRFALWNQASAGSVLHQEDITTTLVDGYYTVVLGQNSGNAIDVSDLAGDAWLEITVDPPASPLGARTPLTDVPSAVTSSSGGGGSTWVQDHPTAPTTCVQLSLAPGTYNLLQTPVNCTTGAAVGPSQDGSGVWSVGGQSQTSCLTYHATFPSSRTVDGKYLVDPDGAGTTYSPTVVRCDMNNGGWTLVANISATSRAHISAAAVSTELLAEDQPGKLSDAMINALKTTVGFKFTCNARTLTFLPTCNFGGATTATGACLLSAPTTDFGLSSSDGSVGIGYGSASGGLLGCAEHGITWGRAGRVWVK
jgi:hypothetical protein